MNYVVKVKPGAKTPSRVEKGEDGVDFVVFLHERPKEGEANKALVEILAKHFKVAKGQVEIRSGFKARLKRVEIMGEANGA
ncbi:DUF167 domain-containing protein [Candidatus Saccharibacteria bacterium]|nr:DUF167 domain-containing protein [Candidatus Saccharibacteria bacterium]